MNETKHLIKKQQRGIPNYLLKVIEENGEYLNAPGGAIKIHLGNREYQNIVHETKHFYRCWIRQKMELLSLRFRTF